MESWALQKNSLIKYVDSQASQPKKPKILSNSLKTIKYCNSKVLYGSATAIYGRSIQFEVSRRYTNLAQLYIKCNLKTTTNFDGNELFLASKIFKTITLSTMNGTTLQQITPAYTQMRFTSLSDTPLYSHIEKGMDPENTNTTTTTVIVPLFFFFSEHVSSFLDTRNLEQLCVNCIVNDNRKALGLKEDLTEATFEMFMVYHDENTSNSVSDNFFSVKHGLPKSIINSYGVHYEDDTKCAVGTKEANVLIRSNHPTFAIHFSLVSNYGRTKRINKLTMTIAGVEVIVLDYRMNYSFYSNNNSIVEADTFSLWLNKTSTRITDSGLCVFTEHMFPTFIKAEFDVIELDASFPDELYTLKTFAEHRTMFSITDRGFIRHSTDDEYEGYIKWQQTFTGLATVS